MPPSAPRLRQAFARWVRRRQGLDVLPLRLARRRVYILPTRAGWAFAVLVLGMLFGGLNYGNSLALLLCFSLAGFGLVAMMRCHARLLGVRVLSVDLPRAFAGEPLAVHVQLEPQRASTAADLVMRIPGSAAARAAQSGTGAQVTLQAAPAARGPWPLPPLRLATRAPFGLFEAWTWLHLTLEGLVWPAPRGERPLPPGAGSAGRLDARLTGVDEWSGLRPFRDADSPRQVAWKAYARGAPLLVREYHDPAGGELALRWEALPGLDPEARLSQLARWVLDAAAAGERWSLQLPGTHLAAGYGPAHRDRCLDLLARVGFGAAP